MIKKILILLLATLIIMSVAIAKENTMSEEKNKINNIIQKQIETQNQEQTTNKGLETAINKIQNQEMTQHLEKSITKMQTQNMIMLNNMEELEFNKINDNNEIEAKGKKEAKFLGLIKAKHTYRYTINENGDVKRNKRFFDILWKE